MGEHPFHTADQYRQLGVDVESFPVIYSIEDWSLMKDAVDAEFMRRDLQFTKGQGRTERVKVKIDDKNEQLTVKMDKCKGI